MTAGIRKRLSWIELVLTATTDESRVAIDLSIFSDAEIDRLAALAERRLAWVGDDWLRDDLTPEERLDLDALLAKVN